MTLARGIARAAACQWRALRESDPTSPGEVRERLKACLPVAVPAVMAKSGAPASLLRNGIGVKASVLAGIAAAPVPRGPGRSVSPVRRCWRHLRRLAGRLSRVPGRRRRTARCSRPRRTGVSGWRNSSRGFLRGRCLRGRGEVEPGGQRVEEYAAAAGLCAARRPGRGLRRACR